MPHINRLRVNNVKYNFGTQYYDDFMMKPYGKNMLYDLANGGGKSVLMLLLLQTVIPNCTLDDKQPVEKLFRTSGGSSTIHSLIEWKLNDNNIKDGFQYMTTGFCARKGTTQEEKDTASIDYFNYCIFYREYNDNDIRNLPLVNDNERITYSGLKQYLKDIQRIPGLHVEIFDRKGEYQQFISGYGIYESEWEIIRGINKTEGHVRTYFETNYKTTRKVVEDLLIEEIIQKSYNRYLVNESDSSDGDSNTSEDNMATTLLNIKDKLIELSQKKATVNLYDRQTEIIDGLKERLSVLDHVYTRSEELKMKLHQAYNYNERCIVTKQADYEQLCKEQDELDRKMKHLEIIVEAAKLQKNETRLVKINQEISQLTKEIQLQEDLLDRKQKDISLKESMNDYLEYLREKSNRDELKESLEAIKGGSKVEINELYQLVYNKKFHMDQKVEELEEAKATLTDQLREAEDSLTNLSEEERNLDIERAIKENALSGVEEKIVSLKQKLNQMRKNVSLLFLEEVTSTIHQVEEENKASKDKLQAIKQELDTCQETLLTLKTSLQIKEEKKARLATTIKEYEEWIEKYKIRQAEYEKLLEVYHIVSKDNCLQELEEQYKTLVTKMIKCKERIQVNERYLSQLMERNLDVESEGLTKVKEYLEKRYKDQVITGTAYLHTLTEKDRENLLRKIPIIPYSLIVMEDYEALLEDRYFRRKDFGAYAIPILNLEEIKQGTISLSKKSITFAMKEEELFYREERMAEEESIVRGEVEEEKELLRKLEQQEDILKKDMEKVRYHRSHEQAKYAEVSQGHMDCKQELDSIEEEIHGLVNDYMKREQSVTQMSEEVLAITEAIEEKEQEHARLVEIEAVVGEKRVLEEEGLTLRDECEQLRQRYERICEMRDEWRRKHTEWKTQVDSVDKQLEFSKDQWTTLFLPYYKEGEFEVLSLSEEELDARFLGKKDAFEKEYSDLGDKERLLNSYVNSMNRSLKAIAKRKISLATLEEMRNNHSLFAVSDDVLQSENADYVHQETILNNLRESIDEKKALMYQLGGKVEEARAVAEEKFGDAFKETLKQITVDTNIEEQKDALQVMIVKKQSMKEEFLRSERAMKVCENAKEDMERIYRQMELPKNTAVQEVEIEDMEGFVKKLSRDLELIAKDTNRKRDEFYQQLQKTAQTLELLKAYELAQELRTAVTIPSTLEESSELKNNLTEVCDCIRLERTRVEQGLEDMERIKQSFENQCLQRCDNVKAALERLPKLSKIMLDNEQIPMIGLSIPYVNEELQGQRMSDYIDTIVAGVDKYETPNDKIKYIKTSLSLKRLFSVIVTDMNRIKLTLYKRERIKEQSRHLRYEEAVGSTGQSQGIYIQFLIAIINYITYMNSGNIDNTGLRKVIFIDNPFGAAKDVYIWEPIFELLKMNQVQLIVPARGTTPAITGKFDVNYILGQRLNDKKQQTVVVEYHSNVDTTEMEYIPLQYEQTSLFD
jgi:chromosome segregation ATPase